MPSFPIIDSHVHLYDPDRIRMPGFDDSPILNRRYGLKEFREHTAGIAVEGLVFAEVNVSPFYALIEAQWVASLAAQDPIVKGIVAQAPVEFGERARVYYETVAAVSPLVKGVRQITQWESDPEFCLRPDFVRGVQILPEYGLSFDICILHHQLASHIELVRRCPETSFILDHIAKPDMKQHPREPWWTQIAEMAALPNVVCKVSGIPTEADHERWTIDDVRPYMERVFEVFGEDRVMYGGDWSVVLLASTYRRWYDTVETVTAGFSETARRKFWADNARRWYRLA